MNDKSLSIAFGDSLEEDSMSCVSDLVEVGLDSILEEGILRDIPILSTVINIYKIGNSFSERQHIKKLSVFLNELSKGIVSEQKRLEYQEDFQNNKKFRNQEIEYLLVLIDRYINYEKPSMLAKLYLAYLNQKISWIEFCQYAEIVDSFLPGDQNYLFHESAIITYHNNINSGIIRLTSLGLLMQTNSASLFVEHGQGGFGITKTSMHKAQIQEKIYSKTDFGKTLAEILQDK